MFFFLQHLLAESLVAKADEFVDQRDGVGSAFCNFFFGVAFYIVKVDDIEDARRQLVFEFPELCELYVVDVKK